MHRIAWLYQIQMCLTTRSTTFKHECNEYSIIWVLVLITLDTSDCYHWSSVIVNNQPLFYVSFIFFYCMKTEPNNLCCSKWMHSILWSFSVRKFCEQKFCAFNKLASIPIVFFNTHSHSHTYKHTPTYTVEWF